MPASPASAADVTADSRNFGKSPVPSCSTEYQIPVQSIMSRCLIFGGIHSRTILVLLMILCSEDRMYWASSRRNPSVLSSTVVRVRTVYAAGRQGTGVLLPSLQPMQASAAVFGDFRDESGETGIMGSVRYRSHRCLSARSCSKHDSCQI